MSIERVAKYAGVSAATVSRVLNSVPVVSASTVQAVKAAMVALNYDPVELRRGPRPRNKRVPVNKINGNRPPASTGTIALVTVGHNPNKVRALRLPVVNAVVEAITQAAKQNGLQVLLDDMPSLADISDIIRKKQVDGALVLLADLAPLDVLAEISQHVPVVWAMGGQAGPLLLDHVCENNIAIGHLAHQYLTGRGCGEVAFLTAEADRRFSQQRRQALAGAASEMGQRSFALLVSDNPLVNDLFGSNVIARASLVDLVEAFVAMSPRPDGLFIDRDATTAQVYPLLLKHGIQPGRDVIIVSCDNEEVRLSALYPRPASIDLGTTEIGVRAVRRLLLRIENPDEPPIFIQAMPRLQPGDDEPRV